MESNFKDEFECIGENFGDWYWSENGLEGKVQYEKCRKCRDFGACFQISLVKIIGKGIFSQLQFNGALNELINLQVEESKKAEQLHAEGDAGSKEIDRWNRKLRRMGVEPATGKNS